MNDRDYETLRKAALEIKPGELRLVEKGLYGMPCSGNIFDKSLAGVQGEAGYERVETGVAVKRGEAKGPAHSTEKSPSPLDPSSSSSDSGSSVSSHSRRRRRHRSRRSGHGKKVDMATVRREAWFPTS
uniref:Uncharacterized protein n=1 Tax=Chromera velia CCMP2878 TaxID=1169474 RepID=A0A0G4FES6_9ALVE|eukprot:Cvel_16552.t1-p1 / transcript=Cvel_16552.t1 / gene=Cvel_16552 / organism=Chromera_velia_CCMP2878 / gene_product=hypothetical protein / transcript_product=hypothetical protein / location=Cvel_scaffold1280:921-5788(-) / protein_length=127 / sequence_SO=supercontig / SO=protein_coding / is_pseudo=false